MCSVYNANTLKNIILCIHVTVDPSNKNAIRGFNGYVW